MPLSRRAGEALYALLFVVIVPLGLVLWARALDTRLALPVPRLPIPGAQVPAAGAAIVLAGAALMAAGMWALMKRGGGLPMNAFPPPRFVRSGIYRWVSNPIYLGFGGIVGGTALMTRSSAGFFVVTPVVVLAMIALVQGYERPGLLRRFGDAARVPPLLSIPPNGDEAPTLAERVAVLLFVIVPWLLVYFAIQALGPPSPRVDLSSAFERRWPIWQWTEALYASAYLQVPLAAFVAASRTGLRRFAFAGAVSTIVVGLCWLVIPAVYVHRQITPDGLLGHLLAYERDTGTGALSFPAFHVLWALLAADVWADRARVTGRAAWRVLGFAWAIAIAASTVTAGMHNVADVAAAALVYFPLHRPDALWQWLRRGAERLANSWREWRFGPVRVINHGVYAAAGAGVCIVMAGSAIGPEHTMSVVWEGTCILLGAGLWAQWLEGSSRLLRPFGWYGGVTGALIGGLTARMVGVHFLPLLASFAVGAPWMQLLGRLRCLVNGCCHGGPASETVGIRYRHRRTRVSRLAGLSGVPIHPTPLYSILGNVVIGLLMFRLRMIGAPDAFVFGAFLMLGGVARFVEESFRAEPQTRHVAGLPIYQWLAIASLVGGMIVSTLASEARPAGFAAPQPPLLLGALALALAAWFAMGVDFPNSNARFSRLAEAD